VGVHCVIGAGAVVTRTIPPYAITAGVPARVIRSRAGAPAPGSGAGYHSCPESNVTFAAAPAHQPPQPVR
jgi:serine acetyltransferase